MLCSVPPTSGLLQSFGAAPAEPEAPAYLRAHTTTPPTFSAGYESEDSSHDSSHKVHHDPFKWLDDDLAGSATPHAGRVGRPLQPLSDEFTQLFANASLRSDSEVLTPNPEATSDATSESSTVPVAPEPTPKTSTTMEALMRALALRLESIGTGTVEGDPS
ncbi:hypothetical protein CONPUDRAFT_160371 [Coniophora puteana RWD-64-598 SS2]|uniref:Uncharacterized protein n=1 Tax=Coniophora puteana (strain RWD-64-598) TaxID=741705 RepID=R7SD65_CONPW|nr:uncharacterized protein CONPUDRAFT_160371 [Coniophora puteana RWD-64-598 SS2]EIW74116.1 hypothetical protein CONPUDRAFT_160371 [Coniophora puteana RWD-64-598 SS2]